MELVRRAKAEGLPVSCETAPHYLVLTDMDLREEGRFKMNPPIRSAEDRAALVRGIQDGTIEVVATDHAPHSEAEKAKGLAGSAFGIVGLETAFPVLYTRLVLEDVLSLERLVELMSVGPGRLFGLGGTIAPGRSGRHCRLRPRGAVPDRERRFPFQGTCDAVRGLGSAGPERDDARGRARGLPRRILGRLRHCRRMIGRRKERIYFRRERRCINVRHTGYVQTSR